MCFRKSFLLSCILGLALCCPLLAWYMPAKGKAVEQAVISTPALESSEELQSESVTEPTSELATTSESSVEPMTDLSEALENLKRDLKESRAKEAKYLSSMDALDSAIKLSDADYEELNKNYEALKADYAKASEKAGKYRFATPFVQVNALARNPLAIEWGVEGVVGARFGNLTTQVGAGYFFTDNPWNENLEVKAGIGWEF